jgi:hypothetical protein
MVLWRLSAVNPLMQRDAAESIDGEELDVETGGRGPSYLHVCLTLKTVHSALYIGISQGPAVAHLLQSPQVGNVLSHRLFWELQRMQAFLELIDVDPWVF